MFCVTVVKVKIARWHFAVWERRPRLLMWNGSSHAQCVGMFMLAVHNKMMGKDRMSYHIKLP